MIELSPEEVAERIISQRFKTPAQVEKDIMRVKMTKRQEIEDRHLTINSKRGEYE